MAREENSGLLGEIVNQLKALNKASSTDMLREAEALKRAEKLQKVNETTADFSSIAVNDSKDFQRRFLSAQASTIVNETRNLKPGRAASLEATKKTREEAEKRGKLDAAQQVAQTKALEKVIPDQLTNIQIMLDGIKAVNKDISGWSEKLFDIWKSEQGPHSFAVHDATTAQQLESSFAKSLKWEEERAKAEDMQRRNDIRTKNENLSEKNKVAGSAAGGWGAFSGINTEGDLGGDEGWIPDDIESGAQIGIGASLIMNYKKVLGLLGISKYASAANAGKTFSQIWKLRIVAMGAWFTSFIPGRALAANSKWGKWLGSGNKFKIIAALVGISAWLMMDSIKAFFGVEGANPHDNADFKNWESDPEAEDGFFQSTTWKVGGWAANIAMFGDIFFNKSRIHKAIGRGIMNMFKGVGPKAMTIGGFIFRNLIKRGLVTVGGVALAGLGMLSAPVWATVLTAGYVGWKIWQFTAIADELKTLDLPGMQHHDLSEAATKAVMEGTWSDGTPLFDAAGIDDMKGADLVKAKKAIMAAFASETTKGQKLDFAKNKKKQLWDLLIKKGYSAKFLNSILEEMQENTGYDKGAFESRDLRFKRMGLLLNNITGTSLTDTREMGTLTGHSGNGIIIGKNTALEDNSFHQHLATMIFMNGQQPQTWTNSSIEPFSWYHGNYGTE